MRIDRIRHLPVVSGGRLVGVVTQRDLLRATLPSGGRRHADGGAALARADSRPAGHEHRGAVRAPRRRRAARGRADAARARRLPAGGRERRPRRDAERERLPAPPRRSFSRRREPRFRGGTDRRVRRPFDALPPARRRQPWRSRSWRRPRCAAGGGARQDEIAPLARRRLCRSCRACARWRARWRSSSESTSKTAQMLSKEYGQARSRDTIQRAARRASWRARLLRALRPRRKSRSASIITAAIRRSSDEDAARRRSSHCEGTRPSGSQLPVGSERSACARRHLTHGHDSSRQSSREARLPMRLHSRRGTRPRDGAPRTGATVVPPGRRARVRRGAAGATVVVSSAGGVARRIAGNRQRRGFRALRSREPRIPSVRRLVCTLLGSRTMTEIGPILMATDFSTNSALALDLAATLAHRFEQEVVLLHVEEGVRGRAAERRGDRAPRARADGARALPSAARGARRASARGATAGRSGARDPARRRGAHARGDRVGTHGRSPTARRCSAASRIA